MSDDEHWNEAFDNDHYRIDDEDDQEEKEDDYISGFDEELWE